MLNPNQAGRLYLIPTPLLGQSIAQALSSEAMEIASSLKYFIVENAKSARAFLKQLPLKIAIQQIEMQELNEHTKESNIEGMLAPIKNGISCGLLSETGAPCLADPGKDLVRMAHQLGIEVIPVVGPSAVMMAIICSGLNGQNFSFCGYLPAKSPERENKIKELEKLSSRMRQSQFFIETPYRADKILSSLLQSCHKNTKISIAVNLGSQRSYCAMKSVEKWKENVPDLNDKLVVFGLEAK